MYAINLKNNVVFAKSGQLLKKTFAVVKAEFTTTAIAAMFIAVFFAVGSFVVINSQEELIAKQRDQYTQLKNDYELLAADYKVYRQNVASKEQFVNKQIASLKARWCLPF